MTTLAVRGVVLHVSASRFGDAAQIDRWHRENGWRGIGYHRVILNGIRRGGGAYDAALDGTTEFGRRDTVQGAHCAARGMNRHTLGFCLIGSPGWTPQGAEPAAAAVVTLPYLTAKQFATLVTELAAVCRSRGLDPLGTFALPTGGRVPVISQHSDHDPGKPLCASLNLDPIRRAVAEALG